MNAITLKKDKQGTFDSNEKQRYLKKINKI